MKNTKRIISIALSSLMVMSSASVLAETGDVWNKDDQTLFAKKREAALLEQYRRPIATAYENYLFELNGKLYDYEVANNVFKDVNGDRTKLETELAKKEAIVDLEEELKVESVSAITTQKFSGVNTQLEFSINGNATKADVEAIKAAGYTVEYLGTKGVSKTTGIATADTSFEYQVVIKDADGKEVAKSNLTKVKITDATDPKVLEEVSVVKEGTSIKVSTLVSGESYKIKVDKYKNLQGEEKVNDISGTLKYKSSNTNVVLVDETTGKLVPMGAGSASITISKTGMNDYVLPVTVKTETRAVTTLEGLSDAKIAIGSDKQVTVTAKDQYGELINDSVTVTSADSNVASVSATTGTTTNGKTSFTVTAVAEGTTTVDVKIGNKTEKINITAVEFGDIASYQLEGSTNELKITSPVDKEDVTLKLSEKDANGVVREVNLGTKYTVSTEDTDVVTLSGLNVKANKSGTATILVKEGDIVRASYEIVVKDVSSPQIKNEPAKGITVNETDPDNKTVTISSSAAKQVLQFNQKVKLDTIKIGTKVATKEQTDKLSLALGRNIFEVSDKFDINLTAAEMQAIANSPTFDGKDIEVTIANEDGKTTTYTVNYAQ